MAERDYRSPQERAQATALPQAVRGGQVGPQPVEQVSPSLASQALQGLLNIGGQVAQQKFQQDVQAQYLEGQRARMTGMAFEEVDSNPLTKPFVRGGYQDQDYRMRQASFVAEAEQYIQGEGKEQSPEEFSKYLSERSQQVLDSIGGGLSTQGRAEALQSQTAAEASLIASQTKAYANYSTEQAAKRITTQGNQIISDLTQSKTGSEAEHTANAARAMGYFQNILQGDGSIPEEMRPEIAAQFVQALASSDNNQVVEAMRDNGLLDTLGFDTRVKLDGALRESKNRTQAVDSLGHYAYNAKFETDVKEGRVNDPAEVRAYVASEVNSGRMTASGAESLYRSYYASQSDYETKTGILTALNRGDVSGLAALGTDPQAALKLFDEQAAKQGMALPERAALGIRMGMQVGEVPTGVGSAIGSALNSIANPNGMNPEQRDLLNSVLSETNTLRQSNPAAAGVLLDGLPESTRGVMSAMLSAAEDGRDPYDTARELLARPALVDQMDSFQKQTMGKQFQNQVMDKVQDEYGAGWMSRAFNAFLPTTPKSNNVYVESSIGNAIMGEAQRLSRDPNNIALFSGSDDAQSALIEQAASNVRKRSIVVGKPQSFLKDGIAESLLVLPRNVPANKLFGTDNTAELGTLLAERYPPAADGYTTAFRFSPSTGRLTNLQVDSDGVVRQESEVDPKAIGKEATQRRERTISDARDAKFGTKYQVQTPDGAVGVDIDGLNTAGMPTRGTLSWRRRLVQEEGLRLTAYTDTTGNTTVGIGGNVQGDMKPGDQIPLAEAERMFRERSDQALNGGLRLAKSLGVTSDDATFALADAVYQVGYSGMREFKATEKAIQDKDWDGFVAAVRDSKWAKQTPKRVRNFIEGMRPHFTE